MEKQIVKIIEGGRILIPVKIRHRLNFEAGREVVLEVEGENLKISPFNKTLYEAQALVSNYTQRTPVLTEQLLALRKEEQDD